MRPLIFLEMFLFELSRFDLVGLYCEFYGISTIVGYLMPSPFLYK